METNKNVSNSCVHDLKQILSDEDKYLKGFNLSTPITANNNNNNNNINV